MKRITILSLALAAMTTFTSLASADTSRWNDSWDGRARVRHGVNHGQLTRAEAMRLRMMRLQIRRLERMAMADGRVTRREWRMIQQAKAQYSRALNRFQHNGRYA